MVKSVQQLIVGNGITHLGSCSWPGQSPITPELNVTNNPWYWIHILVTEEIREDNDKTGSESDHLQYGITP